MLGDRGNHLGHESLQSKGRQGGSRTVTKYETTFILEPGFDDARVNDEIERVSQSYNFV